MKPRYTKETFENAKSTDKLEFECYYCYNIFFKLKKYVTHNIKYNKNEIKFCNRLCRGKSELLSEERSCKNCNKKIIVQNRSFKKSKSGNSFCSKSCSASFNNKNKRSGNRRSKMEGWIEEELKKRYNFEIIFNGKEAINSELDIYIPSLKLAFELNGIFHYEPIYGSEKLNKIKNNDDRKIQACLEKNIELCIIDTSGSINFKPDRDEKYLIIIESIIIRKIKKRSR